MGAVKLGSKKLVLQQLLRNASAINQEDELGNTPLHYAVNIASYEISHVLLTYHAQVNRINNQGLTPLHVALKQGNIRLVKLLLKHGADPNIPDAQKNSPLHLASTHAHTRTGLQILELLVAYGAQPDHKNEQQQLPHCVISAHHKRQSDHPIHHANLSQAQQILQAPSSAAHITTAIPTQRHYLRCAKTNNVRKMQQLLKHPQLNINAQSDRHQRTALMQAICKKRPAMAKLLIASGVDTKLRDRIGNTAYEYACSYGQDEIAHLLKTEKSS